MLNKALAFVWWAAEAAPRIGLSPYYISNIGELNTDAVVVFCCEKVFREMLLKQ
jgi:hypothetical protein